MRVLHVCVCACVDGLLRAYLRSSTSVSRFWGVVVPLVNFLLYDTSQCVQPSDQYALIEILLGEAQKWRARMGEAGTGEIPLLFVEHRTDNGATCREERKADCSGCAEQLDHLVLQKLLAWCKWLPVCAFVSSAVHICICWAIVNAHSVAVNLGTCTCTPSQVCVLYTVYWYVHCTGMVDCMCSIHCVLVCILYWHG